MRGGSNITHCSMTTLLGMKPEGSSRMIAKCVRTRAVKHFWAGYSTNGSREGVPCGSGDKEKGGTRVCAASSRWE